MLLVFKKHITVSMNHIYKFIFSPNVIFDCSSLYFPPDLNFFRCPMSFQDF